MVFPKRALITGITGQDGSYLAEFLVSKGYNVHGMVRRASTFNRERIDHLCGDIHVSGHKITLHYGDLTDSSSIEHVMSAVSPDEIYHLGAQSHVGASFQMPEFTGNVTGLSAVRMLEAMRRIVPQSRFYQASSSEMFGDAREIPQKETTPFYPRSPYGAAKVYAYWITVNHRESYGLHASNGILFNHESPRRGENFVTRKITIGLAQILAGKKEKLFLGNLNTARDWGYAGDYVEGMWKMLQQDAPGDYVLATNESHTVREFVEEACRLVGMDIVWEGSGLEERGMDKNTGKTIIEIDSLYFRPAEVNFLQGDYSKARESIGWAPKVTFKELVRMMLRNDMEKEGVQSPLE